MGTLRRALRREWRLQVLAALLLTLAGLAMPLLFFGRSMVLAVLGLALGLTGLRLLFRNLQTEAAGGHRLLRLLEQHPRQIVWVYSIVTQRLPFGFNVARDGIMYFKLADGDEITVSLPADRLPWISRYLNDRLPHATFGYSRDREQWYLASPYLLLREEKE